MEYPATPESTVYPPLSNEAVILTGPTASGKSAVAIQVAERIGGEIISLDSIAVYRGMNIGTAKPTFVDRQRVPHHLLDVVSVSEDFSAAQYLARANQCVCDILARGKRPLFVGGTPLYLKALLYGFDSGPPADWEFRRSVEEDIRTHGIAALHARLAQVDPLSAHRLPPSDTRRITRALEVAFLTGMPLSHRQKQFEAIDSQSSAKLFSIAWPREILHQRIESRVKQMFDVGLVDEVKGLLREHDCLSRTAASAVGYREVLDHLRMNTPLDQTMKLVLFHTRQLARRQETWFRSLPTLRALAVHEEAELERAQLQIVESIIRS